MASASLVAGSMTGWIAMPSRSATSVSAACASAQELAAARSLPVSAVAMGSKPGPGEPPPNADGGAGSVLSATTRVELSPKTGGGTGNGGPGGPEPATVIVEW